MQQQNNFRFFYNGKELSKEEFNKLDNGQLVRWFDNNTVRAVDFDSNFFDGGFKSLKDIEDYFSDVFTTNKKESKDTLEYYIKSNREIEDLLERDSKSIDNIYNIKILKYNREDVKDGYVGKNGSKFRVTFDKILKPLDIVTVDLFCGDYLIVEEVIENEHILSVLGSENDNLIAYPEEFLKCGTRYYKTTNSFLEEYLEKRNMKITPNTKVEKLEGVKLNNNKPQMSLLFIQFPKALEAIVKCSEYGNQKYKETDKDFLNFKRVNGGSKIYADASIRHRLEKGLDKESSLPHQFHVAWNALAELELWIEENKEKLAQ